MDFPISIDTIGIGLPIVCFKGSQVEVSKFDVFLSLKVLVILAKCADPDEICQITRLGISSIKGLKNNSMNILSFGGPNISDLC